MAAGSGMLMPSGSLQYLRSIPCSILSASSSALGGLGCAHAEYVVDADCIYWKLMYAVLAEDVVVDAIVVDAIYFLFLLS